MEFDLIFTVRKMYINSHLDPLTRFRSKQQKDHPQRYPPMDYISSDHRDHPNPHKNSYKLCDETRVSLLSLKQSQQKLRQQHDQSFQRKGKLHISAISAN